jgi:general secretion pathway protein E
MSEHETTPRPDTATGKDAKLPPFSFARKRGGTVERWNNEGAVLALSEQAPLETLSELHRFVGRTAAVNRYPVEQYRQLIQTLYHNQQHVAGDVVADMTDDASLDQIAEDLAEPDDLLESHDDAPIIRLLNALLTEAVKLKASDIHIEPFEDRLSVRYRIDGVLQEIITPARAIAPLIASRVKIMAKLDIAEKRLPQDGRISLRIAGRPVDVRVSTIPGAFGERIVMRLLDKQTGALDLATLGMDQATLDRMQRLIRQPHGIVLVTGPTGSGKTTTLYAALAAINDRSRNIMTIEDPIEYNLPGISQTPVNDKVGMSFAKGLRAVLRQDPDVIMVGEIRDLETAEIATQASLTGHLVLSTLHTNTAVGAITRLVDMGIAPFLLASSLKAVLAQRLVRVLNPETRMAYQPDARERALLGLGEDDITLYKANPELPISQAYQGRTGIYELVEITPELQKAVHAGATEQELESLARKNTPSILDDGIAKIRAGITSVDEVLRVTRQQGS